MGVTPLYPPSSRVGAWLSTHEHLRAMVDRGHDVEVLTVLRDATYSHEGVRVSGIGWGATGRLRDANVCISHMGDRMGRAAAAARTAGVPHVVMVHGPTDQGKPDADLVVFNSESSRVDWGIPSIVAHPHTRFQAHAGPRGSNVTLVNLSEDKGGNVFRRVAEIMPDVDFLGVHGGYGEQVKMSGLRNVRMISATANMRRHVWSHTRILLMPSKAETWGMVGVEAMCSGIPVIAHPTPGLKESLGDAGTFVDRDDIDGWVDAIRQLSEPRSYAVASAKANQRAAALCEGRGLDRFVDAVEDLVA